MKKVEYGDPHKGFTCKNCGRKFRHHHLCEDSTIEDWNQAMGIENEKM